MTYTQVSQELIALPNANEPVIVLFLRGIPASGKSTFAKAHLSAYPAGSVLRVNNDELSEMFFGAPWGVNPEASRILATARFKLIETALSNPAVRLVIMDNTNLQTSALNELVSYASSLGAKTIVDDRFLSVPVEECIRRDAERQRPVGEGIIRKMASTASRLTPWTNMPTKVTLENYLPTVPAYENDESLPKAIIVDIDGTLALMGKRNPYAWNLVDQDLPNTPVVEFVKNHLARGERVIIMSGRDSVCKDATKAWLDEHVASNLPLFMRDKGDNRPDFLVKHELFLNNIAGQYHINLVLDDRQSVVALWRRLGLNCWQVAEGDF